MPYLTVIAGPNGSGKTTLTSLVREAFQDTPVLDPDARVMLNQGIQPEASSLIEAGREVLVRANELLQACQSFVVETTLSGNTYLRMMRQAKALDYTIVLVFVGTQSVEINLQRVRERVASGGHDVPEADQRRRYPRSGKSTQSLRTCRRSCVVR